MRSLCLAALGAAGLLSACGTGGTSERRVTATVTQRRAASAAPRGRVVRVRVIKEAGNTTSIIAPVSIDGRGPFEFLVDTGASQSLIAPKLVRRLHLHRAGGRQKVAVVGGSAKVRTVALTDWRVGKVRLPRQRILSLTQAGTPQSRGVRGLLGSDVLSSFGLVQVDYRRGILRLGRRRG